MRPIFKSCVVAIAGKLDCDWQESQVKNWVEIRGGTFTDVYVFTPHGQTVRAKVPTTIPDQSIGIKNGITKARIILKEQFGWSGTFQFIHHGTTTATNAVLEGKGARTALVVTAGHKDILALRRSQIPGGLGAWLNWSPPEPIVPLERVVQSERRPQRLNLHVGMSKGRNIYCTQR